MFPCPKNCPFFLLWIDCFGLIETWKEMKAWQAKGFWVIQAQRITEQKQQHHSGWKSQKKSHSKLRAQLWGDKSSVKMQKIGLFWRTFDNLTVKQCYQTGHFLMGQKVVENAKTEIFKYDILSNFQPLYFYC